MDYSIALGPLAALLLSPLLLGVITKVKSFMAGRQGKPLLQLYFDLFKLLRRGATYSRTTTWVFRAGPILGLAAMMTCLLLLPLGGLVAPIHFEGDLLLFLYLLSLVRFVTVLAALDTGSAFEGMGASRELFFSSLAEPALILGLATLAHLAGSVSLTELLRNVNSDCWSGHGPALLLVMGALFVVVLAENARIPVDDPTTHLELTMIHEVMVLDHSGPDLAFILYGSSIKLWVLGGLLTTLLIPFRSGSRLGDAAISVGALFLIAAIVGLVEASMARLQLLGVPKLLIGATASAMLALILVIQ